MLSASAVKSKARALGFDRVGIARAGPAPEAALLRRWIGEGLPPGIEYMARDVETRGDLARFLPGARSVVCVAKDYHAPGVHSDDPRVGRISRYAWGSDYHAWMKERLHALRRSMEEAGATTRIGVDINLVLEKPWAARAGLGWQGKHTNLIAKDAGSWFFLGEVVTTADLEADPEGGQDHCGTCTACIDVCPTRAIRAPYVLDAGRCISYLTIEHRGPIPRELRPSIGNLIFGCDLCQDVCPWNKYARTTAEPGFQPREGNVAPLLVDLMGLSEEAWRARFKGSAVRRAGYEGFLRNVAVALGNSGDASAVGVLAAALAFPSALVRQHAAWALGRLGARDVLAARRAVETDPAVLEEIEAAA